MIYRTDGPWGTGQGTNLSPAQVDGNFYSIETRVAYIEDNPVQPITPIGMTIEGAAFSMGLSDGSVLGPIAIVYPMPNWRDDWAPATLYEEMDFIVAPDHGLGVVTARHTSAATFDWAAVDGSGIPVYQQLIGATGETTRLTDLTDVLITAPADGDLLTWDAATSLWRNEPAVGGSGGAVDWADITGKPSAFPPALPIAQSGVTGLVSDLALKAPLASPVFTGTPSLPTGTSGVTRGSTDNSTALATTAFVQAAIAALPAAGASVTIGAAPPGSPSSGDLWWDSGTTGNLYVYYDDGTSSQWVVAVALPAAIAKYNIGFSFTGGVLGASQLVGLHRLSKAITIPANFGSAGGHVSQAGGTANATASTVISVDRAPAASPNTFAQIGTITFAAGGITPTFATASGATVSCAQGDVLRARGPTTPDTTLANIYLTIAAQET